MGLLSLLFGQNYTNLTNEELKELLKEKNKYQFLFQPSNLKVLIL